MAAFPSNRRRRAVDGPAREVSALLAELRGVDVRALVTRFELAALISTSWSYDVEHSLPPPQCVRDRRASRSTVTGLEFHALPTRTHCGWLRRRGRQ